MFLALREMRFAKARYILIAIIMVLVAFLVLFVTGLAQGLAYDNAASVKNMAATHFVMEDNSNHRFTRSQIDEEQLDAAAAVVGDQNVEPLGVSMTTVIPEGETVKLDITLLAVRPEGWLMPELISGTKFSDLSKRYVLVDQSMTEDGIDIGTVLVDQASGAEWTVNGFVANESFSHTPAVFLSEQDWIDLQMQSPGHPGADEAASNTRYNAIAVKDSADQLTHLQEVLPGTEIITKSEAISAIPGYKEEQGSLLMMIGFLFAISAFVLAVFFYVITIQKTSQFGILKAIGTRTSYLAKSVALQVLVLSVGSLALSILIVQLFKAVLPDSMPFQLGWLTMVITSVSFIVMSLGGSLFSVWKVTKIDALDAIGRTAA